MSTRLRVALLSARPLLLSLVWSAAAWRGLAAHPSESGAEVVLLVPFLVAGVVVGLSILAAGLIAPQQEQLPRWHRRTARLLVVVLSFATFLLAPEVADGGGSATGGLLLMVLVVVVLVVLACSPYRGRRWTPSRPDTAAST